MDDVHTAVSTDRFGRLLGATQADFREALLEHPLAARLRQQRVTPQLYIAWLRETWHLVRHTPAIFRHAAARLPATRAALRDWMLEQADEESGHDRLCVADLRGLGVDVDAALGGRPGAGAWSLITQDWYYAAIGNPVGLLGASSLSEELGAQIAGPVLQALGGVAALPATAFSFLGAHGVVDRKHFEDARLAVNTLITDAEDDELLHARRMAIRHCAQLLDDLLADADAG